MIRDFYRSKGFSLFLYVLVAFTAFFPCLVLGYAYFDNDLMNSFGHFRAFLRSQLLQGNFPLWNPYLMGGQPFFAQPGSMMCYPPNYLTLPFSIPYGLSLFFFLHMVWAAWGMHLWLGKTGLGKESRWLGSLTFALSGFFWWELIHPPFLAMYSWFPWLLWGLENLAGSLKASWAFFTGLCFAFIFCAGEPQFSVYVFYGGGAYFLFRLMASRPSGNEAFPAKPRLGLKTACAFLFFAFWGGLPLLAQLIPSFEYFTHSNRDQPVLKYENFNAASSLKPASLQQFLFPALGVPPASTLEIEIQTYDSGKLENNYLGAMGYLGIWAPFLMVLAFFNRPSRKWFYFLAGSSLFWLLSALGRYFPLHWLECLILPGIALSRAPVRFLGIYAVFACGLCAFGFEALEQQVENKKHSRPILLAAGLFTLILLIASIQNPGNAWVEITGLVFGLVGFFLWAQSTSWKKIGKYLFLASVLWSLLGRGWSGYSLGPPSNFDVEKRFPAFSYLKENRSGERYYFDSSLSYTDESLISSFRCFFPEDAVVALGVRSAGDYPCFDLQEALELREVPFKTFFKLMAVKGLLFGHPVAAPEGYRHISFGDSHLYESMTPPPYLFAPSLVRSFPDKKMNLEEMKKTGFDPLQEAVLGDPLPLGNPQLTAARPAALRYSFLRDDPDDQAFKIGLDQKNLVVFSEIFFPGWKAWIDGQPATLYTADHALRSLFLPAGEHEVEFRYQPVWFEPIIAGAGLWLLSLLTYGFFRIRQKPPKGGPH